MLKGFEDLVFCTINGKPTNNATLTTMMIRTIGRINADRRLKALLAGREEYTKFEPIHMHTLRHSFATRAIENGMKPKVLQGILGHATFGVTMDLYVHITDEEQHKEIQKCEKNGVKMVSMR